MLLKIHPIESENFKFVFLHIRELIDFVELLGYPVNNLFEKIYILYLGNESSQPMFITFLSYPYFIFSFIYQSLS